MRNLARGLARRHDVTLIGMSEGDGAPAVEALAADGIEAHWVPALHHATTARRVRRLVTGRPWFTRASDDATLRRLVAEVTAARRYDLVQLESSEFGELPVPGHVPIVIDEHNLWSELAARRRIVRRAGPRGVLDRIEAWQVSGEERKVWARAAGVAFCSARELDIAAAQVAGGRFAVVPNGVDPAAFVPNPSAEDPRLVMFVGLLRYTPNADAVGWFVQEILPAVRAAVPEVAFEAVGKEPSPSVRALAGPGVRVRGTVPDVRPELARAAVAVVPLRVASGTRIKIVEALAMGTAVVTTSMGVEGLDLRDGEHLLIADQPAAFAAAVVRLLRDPVLRSELGRRGREAVTSDYDWATSVARLEAFHAAVIGG